MKVGLFVPCYVDALYPEAGVSTYKLLRSRKTNLLWSADGKCWLSGQVYEGDRNLR